MKLTGTVKWWSSSKGYGFVIPDNDAETDGQDAILHHSNCIKETHERINFTEDERVKFDLANYGRGPVAINVEKIQQRVFDPRPANGEVVP